MLRWAIKPEINSPVFHLFLTWSHCHADQNTDDQSLLHSTCATAVFLCLTSKVLVAWSKVNRLNILPWPSLIGIIAIQLDAIAHFWQMFGISFCGCHAVRRISASFKLIIFFQPKKKRLASIWMRRDGSFELTDDGNALKVLHKGKVRRRAVSIAFPDTHSISTGCLKEKMKTEKIIMMRHWVSDWVSMNFYGGCFSITSLSLYAALRTTCFVGQNNQWPIWVAS